MTPLPNHFSGGRIRRVPRPYSIPGYEPRDVNDLPFPLRRFVCEFMRANLRLAESSYSQDRCSDTTVEFLEFLDSKGYLDLKDRPPRRWGNDEVWCNGGYGHWAARVDEWIIDFTPRQFDPKTDWPLVWTKADR